MACSAAVRVSRDLPEPTRHGVEIVAVRIERGPLAVSKALSLLVEAERERAARFLVERERERFIVARATLRRLIGERLEVAPGALRLTTGAQGKPALAQPFAASGLRFNVSHSEDLAAYAFAYEREVGIDAEAVRALDDGESIARRFFSASECEEFFSLDPAERPAAFFRCWTRKEAFIKAIGEGLSHPLKAFDVSLKPGEPARLLRVGDCRGEQSGWSLSAFEPAPGFAGAVVVQTS